MASFCAREPEALTELVRRNVVVKARIVARDERESGVRAHLNLGHTFAHAIESAVGYGEILHGEAVGLGIVAAAEVARRLGLCSDALGERLKRLIVAAGLGVSAPLPSDAQLAVAMQSDKKIARARLRFVLPVESGGVVIREDVSPADVSAAWAAIRES